jgi:hypothetical protein
MLFNSRLQEVNSSIFAVQEQISALQAQLHDLQLFQQQLAGIDQAADSAFNQVEHAVQQILAVSPDDLAAFKAAIESLFNTPLQLPAAKLADDEVTPEPAPIDPNNEPQDAHFEELTQVQETGTETTSEEVTEKEVQPSEHTENGHNGNGNGHSDSSKIEPVLGTEDLKKHDRPLLMRLANKQGIQGVKGKKNNQLIAELAGKVTQSDIDQLLATSTK